MGYQTEFTLFTDKPDDSDIIRHFREVNEEARRAINPQGYTNNDSSWDSYEKDLKGFSLKYPEILFTLFGSGSDAGGDYWKLYVKNGKSFMAIGELKYPRFNESKLS
jgi:hypothetical protein